MTYLTTKDGIRNLLQGLGPERRDAHRLPSRLAAQRGRLGHSNDVLPGRRLRVIAHDRRGHGRSTQTDTGNEMDTYAADMIELAAALDLKHAVHVGHSTGGGEVARYVARAEPGRVAKAVLIGAVPPVHFEEGVESGRHPDRGVRRPSRRGRRQPRAILSRLRAGPFYGFNREGAKVSQA